MFFLSRKLWFCNAAMVSDLNTSKHSNCRNPSKSHLRQAIPSAERGPGLLESPSIFNFTAERLINGVRSPQTRQASQPRARIQTPAAFAKREVGPGRVEQSSLESPPGLGRGR